MPAQFEIYKDKKGEFRFRLKAQNGEVIATGEGYSSLQGCKNGIASIKKNSSKAIIVNLFANEDLIKSADKGDLAGVNRALKNGADPNYRDKKGETALIEAVEAGNLNAVKSLLKKGAKINLQDKEGETALHEAIEEGHVNIAKFLIQSGAKLSLKDKKGRTAKQLAEKKKMDLSIFTKKKK